MGSAYIDDAISKLSGNRLAVVVRAEGMLARKREFGDHLTLSLSGQSMTYSLEPGAPNSFEPNSFRCRVNRWLPSEYLWSNCIRRIAFRSWLNWLWRS
jgi:hypothetical protein